MIAKSVGIKRVTGVRKGDLIDQIREKVGAGNQMTMSLGDSTEKPRPKKRKRISAQKVNIEEEAEKAEPEVEVKEVEKTSQKEDELTTYGGSSHIVSYKKEEPKEEKKDHQKGKDQKQRGNRNQRQNQRKRNHEHDQLPVSDKPTLQERLDELIPQLGPYLVNEGTLEILPDGYGFLRSVN